MLPVTGEEDLVVVPVPVEVKLAHSFPTGQQRTLQLQVEVNPPTGAAQLVRDFVEAVAGGEDQDSAGQLVSQVQVEASPKVVVKDGGVSAPLGPAVEKWCNQLLLTTRTRNFILQNSQSIN